MFNYHNMKYTFLNVLLFCVFAEYVNSFDYTGANFRIKRAYYGYLSPTDPKYHEKLEIQRQNLIRIDAAMADVRRNSHKYTFRSAASMAAQFNRLDLTKPDALDGISYFTKNSLYRYRVNKGAVKSVKKQITLVRDKCLRIYDGSVEVFLKSRRKFLDILGNSWRRSYIVSNSVDRPEITFS